MPDARTGAAQPRRLDLRRRAARVARGALDGLRRVYALLLIGVICWLSYGAIRYLIDSLIRPAETPQQIAGVPHRLEETVLHGSRPDWLGLQAVENPRVPLAHYHRFDTWIQPDRFNDCTRSGCHAPLPHTRRKEVRAFLNLHATSMHCGVCHMEPEEHPLRLVWYALDTGRATEPPPLLRAFAWLAGNPPGAVVQRARQVEIVGLLRAAAAASLGDPALARAADRLERTRPGSLSFERRLAEADAAVRRAFRGAYGAKLALRDARGRPRLAHPDTAYAEREWAARGAAATGADRDALLSALHPLRRAQPQSCADCHTAGQSLIDFAGLGYPEARVHMLRDSLLFQMIQHIREGRPFYLPSFGAPPPDPAAGPPPTP